jgi:hypothetical protein
MQYHHHHGELNELLHERATATLPKYSLVVDTPLPELDFYADTVRLYCSTTTAQRCHEGSKLYV